MITKELLVFTNYTRLQMFVNEIPKIFELTELDQFIYAFLIYEENKVDLSYLVSA